MIIAVTGIRELNALSALDVQLATLDAASVSQEMRFGGADGSDTAALDAACGLIRCRVIVPARVADQPTHARSVIRDCADVVEELLHPTFPRAEAYYARNRRLVDGANRLLAFTDGQMRGGTYWTIRYAISRSVPVDLVQVIRSGHDELRVESYVKRGVTGQPFSRPTFALTRYKRSDWRTRVILKLKRGSATDIGSLANELSEFILGRPELRDAEAIVPMPRRIPGVPSDLAPLASFIADRTHKECLCDWLVRVDEPSGGQFISQRMRFSPVEHARTLRVVGHERPRQVIVLDNVLTVGGTMEGAYQAIGRDAPGTTVTGLAAMYAQGVETGL
jgi:hypothetical protein